MTMRRLCVLDRDEYKKTLSGESSGTSVNQIPGPLSQVKLTENEVARFWSKVDKTTWSPCWIWTASRDVYGGMEVRGRRISAHRMSFFLSNCTINDELNVLHRCDVPTCVNPDHLFQGTQLDNMRDKVKKGRVGSCVPKNPCKGEKNFNAKLTAEDVISIRDGFKSKREKYPKIAARYGVSGVLIGRIIRRKAWTHI